MKHFLASMHQAGRCAGLVAGLAVGSAGAQILPPNPDPTCTVSQADFNGWFQSQPGPDQAVKAADSINLDTNGNCNFYKWSAQMFLWLTSPATGPYQGNRVLDSQIFYQLDKGNLVRQDNTVPRNLALRATKFGPDGLPIVIDAEGRLREVLPAPKRVGLTAAEGTAPIEIAAVRSTANGTADFLNAQGQQVGSLTPKVSVDMLPQNLGRLAALAPAPRAANDRALAVTDPRQQIADALTAKKVLIEIATRNGSVFMEAGTGRLVSLSPGQAGGDGVLVSQQDAVVFYEVLVNDVYAWYLTGRKTPNGIAPTYDKNNASTFGLFPTTQSDLKAILDFAQAYGGPSSFPDGNALAVEVKMSWVDASTLPNNAQGYITRQASIPVYDRSNSADWIPQGNKVVTVALVGAHIVGSANGHPEMIWATFEHQANAPLATYTYTSGGQTVTVPSNTAGKWTFSADGAKPVYNEELGRYDSDTGQIKAAAPPLPIGPANVLRQKAWGVAADGVPNQEDATPAAAATQVISLNADVRAKLAAAGAGSDPRFNYLLIGATWTLGGGEPNGQYPANPGVNNEIGTSMLTNSTMETFMQGADTSFKSGTNCFDCHGSSGQNPKVKADTFVSHIFGSINPLPLIAQTKGK
ncbi:hypothetical protein [Methylorubrum sp. SB2]|uniref:hypothetical protein n=1 Tax=Methylorubrum subtropicum TaxID=3138812 RepID=UPI00313B6A86